jgi:hypothetical protein
VRWIARRCNCLVTLSVTHLKRHAFLLHGKGAAADRRFLRIRACSLRLPMRQAVHLDYLVGLVATINRGASPGASTVRTFSKPAPLSHALISSSEKVSPWSEFTSILTAKIKAGRGPVRFVFTKISAMAIVPPGASASNAFFSR